MGVVNIGDIIRATCKCEAGAGKEDVQNVYHLMMAGGMAEDSEVHEYIAAALDTAYTNIADEIPDDVSFTSIQTWNVTQDRPMLESAWPVLTVGGAGADQTPYPVAPLVLFPTGAARSQGRKFLPPFSEGGMTNGLLTAGVMTKLAGYAADILSNVVGPDWLAIFGNWSPSKARFADWVGAILTDILATQRRRRRGRGT
jgi:hypothetical protein